MERRRRGVNGAVAVAWWEGAAAAWRGDAVTPQQLWRGEGTCAWPLLRDLVVANPKSVILMCRSWEHPRHVWVRCYPPNLKRAAGC